MKQLAIPIALALMAIVGATPLRAGPAINQFELKDLDAEPGRLEYQSQNAHMWNRPRRKIARDDDGGLIYDDNSIARQRHAQELEYSFTEFFRMRIGIEFEKERIEDPMSFAEANNFEDLKLEELAIEGVTIFLPVRNGQGVGFGMLVEYQHILEKGELNSIVFGPIVQAESGPWLMVTNILFVHFFGEGERTDEGLERDNKWDFGYATQLLYEVSDAWSLGIEAYGTFDRIGDSGMPGEEREVFGDHDQHRAGPIVYYTFELGDKHVASFEDTNDAKHDNGEIEVSLGVGMFFGLNENTPDHTLKWSVEIEY